VSIWTDGLPAWWAMVVAVAALGVGVLLGELHGRGVGRAQERQDRAAERAVRQVRSWRGDSPATREEAMARRTHPVYRQRRTSTAAFLNPPEVAHEWSEHVDQALDLANDDPTVSAWTQQMAESMDAFLAGLLAEHPVPYLPGEEEQ
jgi:acyl-homoserine lactone acylase PvdQ